MYAVRCTRPDVAFTSNITSRFQQNPGELHWTNVKNILKYLRNTKDMFLVYEDSEYIVAFDASKEAVLIRKFIYRLNVVSIIKEPINMYCDNAGAIAIEMGDVRIEKVDTNDNLADAFTKGLVFPKHSELTKKIGTIPASSLM
ncbi:hypothetical protein Tco_1572444 [Tanacetum coccineum]